jgi:hypothetical protein
MLMPASVRGSAGRISKRMLVSRYKSEGTDDSKGEAD